MESEKAYAAMITRRDRDIGKISALLKELNLDSDTIVFFCSDNGASRRWEGRFDSSGPLRGFKRSMHDGGLRTPMVVRWPGVVPQGEVSDLAWTFADFLPTAADLAAAPIPEGALVDGLSVAPTLRGETEDLSQRFLYWEFFREGRQQAARWKDWKAIRPGVGKPLQLYDLESDPGESRDVAKEHPEVVREFEEFLRTARTESEHWPTPPAS